ncbi:MAG: hypothetical protein ACNA8K_07105 [Cyclonatronaceae bacterium]
MRLLKFAGVFLLVAGIILGFVFYVNWDAFRTVYENRVSISEGSEWVPKTYSIEGLLDYVAEHPEQVSIVSFSPDEPSAGIYYGSEIPRVYGSTGLALLLGEFYRQAAVSAINPDSLVSVEQPGQLVIPGIEESSFRNAVNEAAKAGYIDNTGKIRLDDLFDLNLVKGNLHVHDYLLILLGRENITRLVQNLGYDMDAPSPVTGLYILSAGRLFDRTQEEQLRYLEQLDPDVLNSQAWDYTERYISDDGFRERVQVITRKRGLNLDFIQMRRLYNLMPKIKPADLAQIMHSVHSQSFISPEVSDQVYQKLRWPENRSIIQNSMNRYAAAYDSRMSMLNGTDIGSSMDGQTTRIQVVMFQQLPVSMWMHLSSNFINQELQRMLITNPDFLKKTSDLPG